MSAPQITLVENVPIEERVPEAAQFKKLGGASVVRGRRTTRFVPSTGNTANPGDIITFRLSDANSYLDLQSCYLHFSLSYDQPEDASGV